jgi:hypothetical protein
LAAGLVVGATCVAGCASATSPGTPVVNDSSGGSGPTGGQTGGQLSPKDQAVRAERQLLAPFGSIPGAKVVDQPTYRAEDAQVSETWQVSASAEDAFAEAAAHLPHWPRSGAGTGFGSDQGQYQKTVETTGGRGTLARQSVSIDAQPTNASTNTSTLQVSIEVAYRPTEPAAEHIPDSAVLIVSTQVQSAGKKVITDASTIAQVASDINALPTVPMQGVYACPAIRQVAGLNLVFAASADAPSSASTVVTVPDRLAGICAPGVQVTVNGAEEPALDNSVNQSLFTQLEKLTGVTAPAVGPLQ